MRSRALLLLLAVALPGAWMFMGPASLGGGATYVATHGNSMEPGFQTGDLAIVRPADEYAVGDVAAYHSDRMKTVVMHRIIDVANGRYTLQGDNNDFIDPDRATEDQLVGKLAVRIPQGGIWLDRLTSPSALALLTFGLLATGGSAAHSRHRRRRRTVSQHAARPHRSRRSLLGLPSWATTTAVAAGIAGVLGAGLGGLAWTTPTIAVPEGDVVDAATGRAMSFSYTAEVPESPAYDDTTVTAPEPVFRKLTDTVEVEYAYRGAPGTVSVAAKLSTASGWHSTVPLAPAEEFTGGSHTGTVTLDLAALDRRAQAAAEATGIPASQVDVAVVPTVTTAGAKPFTPELRLILTPLQLTLAGDRSILTVGSVESASPAPTAPEPATIGFAGRELPVGTARILALVLLGGAVLVGALVALFARLSAPATEAAAIHRRYGHMLVRVQPIAAPAGRPVIDVVDFSTLAKLAERYELLILHWNRSDVETFVVQDQGTTYRYRTGVGVQRPSTERIPAVL